jgi:hypothetical protein
MKTIDLTLPELSTALNAAWMRIVASAAQGLNHKSTYSRPMVRRIHEEFIGACGEMAVAKAAGAFFIPSVNTFHRVPDCLGDCEVRSTDIETGSLIVRDNDSDDRKFVLAIVSDDTVKIAGWLFGRDAKKPEWLRDPHSQRPAWFVPQSSLRPSEEIFAWVA